MDAASYLEIFEAIVGTLGILGNGIVCVVIARVPAMRTLTNAIIFNQAVIDFLASVFMILRRHARPPLNPNEVLAFIQCFLWEAPIFPWTFFVASTFNLVLLTLERYVAIMYPFKYLTYFGKTQMTFMLVCVWVLATGYEFHQVIYRELKNGSCERSILSEAAYLADGITTFLFQYLIPLIFMTLCYIHIAVYLKKKASSVQPGQSTIQQGENSISGSLVRARRNTLKTLFIVFVTYTICWSPNQIAFFMYNFGLQLNFQGAFYIISVVLVVLNSCVNPIIYAFKYKQFQRGVRVLLKPCFPKLAVRPDDEMVSTITSRTRPTAA